MDIPEYLGLFSGTGIIDVQVKFKDHDGFISNSQMMPLEISELVTASKEGFLKAMTFDEHLQEVYKYQLDPIKNRLTIYARNIEK